jgi:hypothetical protein
MLCAGAHIDGLRGGVDAMPVQQLLLDRHARAELRRGDRAVDRLGQAYVALDVRQRLELRRKLLQLAQAALRRLRRGTACAQPSAALRGSRAVLSFSLQHRGNPVHMNSVPQ